MRGRHRRARTTRPLCGHDSRSQERPGQTRPVTPQPRTENDQRDRLRHEQGCCGDRMQGGVLVERREAGGDRAQPRDQEQPGDPWHQRPQRPRQQHGTDDQQRTEAYE
jgi:hypothetical protein